MRTSLQEQMEPLSKERTKGISPENSVSLFSRRRFWLIGLPVWILWMALGGSLLWLSPAAPLPTPTVAGQVMLLSSGQLDPASSRGLNDVIEITLNHVRPPRIGFVYAAWLLADKTRDDLKPLLLGLLSVQAGQAHLLYTSASHTNLLATDSRFLVTEQQRGMIPVTPSLDAHTWRYVGEIPSTPTPGDEQGYSLLSHLRHLLASDPTLQSIGLSGGLDTWLARNAGKLVAYTMAARDDWGDQGGTDLLRRQVIRILDYLDGSALVPLEVPPGTPFLIDPKAGRMGLFSITAAQAPPGLLTHIEIHLQGLANAPGHTEEQRRLALQIDQEMHNVTTLLEQVHSDALQLVQMSISQLQQSHALEVLNDLVTTMMVAYIGPFDASKSEKGKGIMGIHDSLQELARIPINAAAR